MQTKQKCEMFKITNYDELNDIEKKYRDRVAIHEFMPWAQKTEFSKIVKDIIPDKKGDFATPLYFIKSTHKASIGMTAINYSATDYFNSFKGIFDIDIISITSEMEDSQIVLKCLIRPYTSNFSFNGFFDYIGEKADEPIDNVQEVVTGKLLVPEEIKNFKYTAQEIEEHDKAYKIQEQIFRESTKEVPFLNRIDKYVPKRMKTPADEIDMIYDLKAADKKVQIICTYEHFIKIFREVMTYVNGVEYYHYINVLMGEESEESFMGFLKKYIETTYVASGRLENEDVPALLNKLYRSLFKLYIVQDLIDDPNVTDIKITAPDAIRARVKGKAYMSNIHFVDRADYLRFVNMIAIRNGISQRIPSQTFTDANDSNYILRFSITAEYVNSVEWPYVHIRKVDRHKPLFNDLIKLGMMDEKIRDYLLDCGKNSRGVVFAGPPGSGKTVILNAFLEEAYEQSAEILVIQENDELFCYRKGVMFQHVVHYSNDTQMAVSLEGLGQLALVAGANVFIIGEAKGAEICSAITLSNSGCRTAITIHSPSSTETIDKMADLAMRGYATDYEMAKRELKSFQTVVYLQDFKVREISEITGYDEEKKDMTYNYIYRDPTWETRKATKITTPNE